MTNVKNSSCRLCLTTILDNNFKQVDDHTKEFLDIPFLKVKFEDDSKPVVCSACFKKLNCVFEFKSMCLNTFYRIFSYADCEKMHQLDLKEVYMKENGRAILYDQKVCVLCMQLVQDEFRHVNDEELDAIQKFIPKVDTSIVKDPIICTSCRDSLYTHNAFLNNCSELQAKIGGICDIPVSENRMHPQLLDLYIKTENIEEFEENEMEISDTYLIDYAERNEKIDDIFATTGNQRGASLSKLFFKSESFDTEENEVEIPLKAEVVEIKAEEDEEESNDLHPSLNYMVAEHNYCLKVDAKTSQHQNVWCVRTHKCDECGYETDSDLHFAAHYRKQTEVSKVCKRNNTKPPSVPQKKNDNGPTYKCEQCIYETKNKHMFLYHFLSHKYPSNVQMMKCIYCFYKTRYKTNLVYHILKHGTVTSASNSSSSSQVRMYKCDSCNYQSRYKNNLADHQSKHKSGSGTDLYKCDTHCGTTTNLTDHQIVHESPQGETFNCDHQLMRKHRTNELKVIVSTEARMFRCNDCDFETKYKKSIINHVLRHKNASQAKKYKCDKCNYIISRRNFHEHQLEHKSSSCHSVYITTKYKEPHCSDVQMTNNDENDIESDKNSATSNVFRAGIKQKIKAILNTAK